MTTYLFYLTIQLATRKRSPILSSALLVSSPAIFRDSTGYAVSASLLKNALGTKLPKRHMKRLAIGALAPIICLWPKRGSSGAVHHMMDM